MISPISVCLVLFEGFSLGSFSAIVESMRVANYLSGRESFRVTFASPNGGYVASSGISQVLTLRCEDVSASNLVILSEQEELEKGKQPGARAFDRWLRSITESRIAVCGMSTGSFRLARAGLLKNVQASIPWFYFDDFKHAFPEIDARGTLMELGCPVMTCVGGIATLDFMLHYITRTAGSSLAAEVADYMVYDGKREPATAQRSFLGEFRKSADKQMAAILSVIEKDPCLNPDELAGKLRMSKRQVERICRKHVNCSPGRLMLRLRLERSRALLRRSECSVQEVATLCGFPSQSHFSQRYKAYFGKSPRSDRISALGFSASSNITVL